MGQKSQTSTMLFLSRWGQILLLIGLTLSTANLRAGLLQKRQQSCSVLQALPFLSFLSATFLFYYFKVTNHVVYINLYKANMVILAGLTGTRLAVFGCPTPGLCELKHVYIVKCTQNDQLSLPSMSVASTVCPSFMMRLFITPSVILEYIPQRTG